MAEEKATLGQAAADQPVPDQPASDQATAGQAAPEPTAAEKAAAGQAAAAAERAAAGQTEAEKDTGKGDSSRAPSPLWAAMIIVFTFLALLVGAFGSLVWLRDRATPAVVLFILLLFSILAMLGTYIFFQGLGGTSLILKGGSFKIPHTDININEVTVSAYGPPATFVLFFLTSLLGWRVVDGNANEIVHVYLRTEDSKVVDRFRITYELADAVGQYTANGTSNHALLPNIPPGAKSLKVSRVECQDYVLNHEKNKDAQPWLEPIQEGRTVNLVMLRSAPVPPVPPDATVCRALATEEAKKQGVSEQDIRKSRGDLAPEVSFTVDNQSGDGFDLFLVNVPWCFTSAVAGQPQNSSGSLVKWRGYQVKWTIPSSQQRNVFKQFNEFADPAPSGWFLLWQRYWDYNTNAYKLRLLGLKNLFQSISPTLKITKAESPLDYTDEWSY